jgi:DNA-binding FadR family transcriptional regulator
MDVWEALTVIEPPLAGFAARECTAEDLTALRVSAENFAHTDADSVHAVHRVAEFFRRLGSASHNPVLSLVQEPLLQLLETSLRQMIDQVPQARTRIATAHKHLVSAVGRGNAADAENWMSKHIRDFRRGFELAGISLTTPIAPSVRLPNTQTQTTSRVRTLDRRPSLSRRKSSTQ